VLEEVIVTAQKREQSANDIGIAITAFSGEQMDALGIESATDVMAFTPGATLTSSGQGIPIYTIRGIGFDDYNSNSSSTVGINFDEVAIPYPIMTRLPQYDIERLEVLKGPQGTLYGQNTTGGTINFITNKPEFARTASIRAAYDSDEKVGLQGHVNGALGEKFAGRAAFFTEDGGAWQENAAVGGEGEENGDQDKMALRLQGLWEPTDTLSVLLKADYHKDESDNIVPQFDRFYFINPDADLGDPGITDFIVDQTTLAGLPDQGDPNSASWNAGGNDFGGQNPGGDFGRDNEGTLLNLRVDWDLEYMTLTSLTSYNDYSRTEANGWDGVATRNWDSFNDTGIEVWSQELRLTSTTDGPLSWITGLYFAKDEVDEVSTGSGQMATSQLYVTPEGLGVDDIDDVAAAGLNFDLFSTQYEQESTTAAIFGHAEYEISEAFSVKLGARYTDDERKIINSCTYDVDGTLANFFNVAVFEGFGEYQQGDCVTLNPDTFESVPYNETISSTNATGQLGLDWRPNDNHLIYGIVSTGYKSGGFGAPAAASWTSLASYDEEEVLSYELGIKSTLADGAVQLNAAIYHYDYDDKQVSSFIIDPVFGALTKIINAPESTVQGAELELNWYATDATLVRLTSSYLDAEYDEFSSYLFGQSLAENPDRVDLSGTRMQNTPEWQHNLMVHHEIDINDSYGAFVGGDWAYSDEFNSLVGNDPVFTVDSYNVLNLRGGLISTDNAWQVTAWVKNLTDEDYFTALSPSNDANVKIMGRERTFGISLQYNFE
ncbi:MAG: TonB-dependent receptor, partial [Halioglobus sp.]